ncbi:restriction endonuclease subunit S [Nakamurella silvestris]|nr:restriction endonuclease subunit S [Nakamurella silvestris]
MSDGWRSVSASSVARIEIGGTPAREQPRFWSDPENGHAWASIADLHAHEVAETAEYISDLGVRSSNVKLVPAGTPLMSFKLTIGRTSVAGRDLYTNEAIAAFFADPNQVDRRYLLHVLPSSARSVITDVAIKGATLNKKSLSSMQLLLPPIEEQRWIAEILDALDDQIESTSRIIHKLKAMRNGVLAKLVDEVSSGVTRPLVDLCAEDICYGIVQSGSYDPSGVPVLSIRDLQGDFETGLHRTSSFVDRRYRRSRVAPGDLLLSIKGTIGRVGVVPNHYQGNISREIARLRLSSVLDPHFVCQYFLSEMAQRRLDLVVVGTTRAEVSIHVLKRFEIPVPDMAAQTRIVASMKKFDDVISSDELTLRKLQSERLGLAKDLLAGDVRLRKEGRS